MLSPDIMLAAGGGAVSLAILDRVFNFIRSQQNRSNTGNGTQYELTRNIHDVLKEIASCNYKQIEVMREQTKAMELQSQALDRISRYWCNPPMQGRR